MVDLKVATLDGADFMLSESVIEDFKKGLRGKLFQPDDQGYDEARKVWNGMTDKRPALIVQCAGVADVISAVNFARDNELLVAVCGGGHSVAGHSVWEGGIMIDLSRMKSVRVDPRSGRRVPQAASSGAILIMRRRPLAWQPQEAPTRYGCSRPHLGRRLGLACRKIRLGMRQPSVG